MSFFLILGLQWVTFVSLCGFCVKFVNKVVRMTNGGDVDILCSIVSQRLCVILGQ